VRLLLAPVAALLLTVPALAQITDSTVVIENNGAVITKFEFEELLASDPRYKGSASVAEGRKSLAIGFGKALGLEAEARRQKLDQDPRIAAKLRHAAHQILAFELLSKLRRDYLDDEALLLATYERSKSAYEQPRVRQIFIRSQGSRVAPRPGTAELTAEQARAKAVSLRAQLMGGADFATLARSESDDLGTRDKGGDMGFILRGTTGASFETVAYTLPLKQVSEVVQTDEGFHILRVEDRQPVPLQAIKAVIANDLAHRKADEIMAGYKLNEAYFSR
jgi:hypothetical protein